MTLKNNDNNENPSKPKMSRGWRAVLVVSLALNLAVVGLVGGAIFRHKGPPGIAGSHRDSLLWALDKDARRDIGAAMRKSRANAPQDRKELAASFADIQSALRAEEFDAVALRAAIARKTAVFQQRRGAGEAALVAYVNGLNNVQRIELADRLAKATKRPRKR